MLIKSLTHGPGLPPPWARDLKLSNGMLAEVNSHDWDCVRWLAGLEPGARLRRDGQLQGRGARRRRSRLLRHRARLDPLRQAARSARSPASAPATTATTRASRSSARRASCRSARCRARRWSSASTASTGLVTPIHRTWPERFAWGYIREMEHFVDCIRRGARAGGERKRRPLGGRRRARRHAVVPGGAAGAAGRGHELMRAAVYHGPGDLRVEERERPTIGPDEALLRVSHCGICGTDQRIVAGKHRLVPAGHDARARPRDRRRDRRGRARRRGRRCRRDLVIVAPNIGCGHCRECLSGNSNRCAEFAGARHHRRRRLRGVSEDTRCGDRAGQRHSA